MVWCMQLQSWTSDKLREEFQLHVTCYNGSPGPIFVIQVLTHDSSLSIKFRLPVRHLYANVVFLVKFFEVILFPTVIHFWHSLCQKYISQSLHYLHYTSPLHYTYFSEWNHGW